MSKQDIIRAWKDEEYRNNLSSEEQALLPEHPAGQIELRPDELEQVAGAATWPVYTAGCCQSFYNSCDFLNCTSIYTCGLVC